MNIYRHVFNARCPSNRAHICYTLEIQADRLIMVEDIVEACASFQEGYHEDIADKLAGVFPETRQWLRAHHHGVDIETVRGEL